LLLSLTADTHFTLLHRTLLLKW